MPVVPDMESFLGKNINRICKNRFHDPAMNHCAHFVCHVMGFDFSFNCKDYKGGNKPAANIRVHEVFANCPRVGKWSDADTSQSQLIFVTRTDAVNLATGTMQNIPEKHIGIYHNGQVYHYSNTNDQVVKQTVPDFLARFEAAYSGRQSLFFGEFPKSDLRLSLRGYRARTTAAAAAAPELHTAAAAPSFALRKDGSRWFARRAGEAEFLVGVEVNQPEKRFHGLHVPVRSYYGPQFDPADYFDRIDQWAYLLDVTGFCESKNRFNLINTYNRARFTFGFYQLAAHTPRDNLILFFRAALQNTDLAAAFPDLKLIGGKVFRIDPNGTETDLEQEFFDAATDEHQLQRFMAYLNPERFSIDEQEVMQAARLVWLANESAACRQVQVDVSAAILQRKMIERYHRWYNLDGESDVVCAAIADIHHQGRGTKTAVRAALRSNDKLKRLLRIGADSHRSRVEALEARLKKWIRARKMGQKTYHAAQNEFV
jgi:hypothetical protein